MRGRLCGKSKERIAWEKICTTQQAIKKAFKVTDLGSQKKSYRSFKEKRLQWEGKSTAETRWRACYAMKILFVVGDVASFNTPFALVEEENEVSNHPSEQLWLWKSNFSVKEKQMASVLTRLDEFLAVPCSLHRTWVCRMERGQKKR